MMISSLSELPQAHLLGVQRLWLLHLIQIPVMVAMSQLAHCQKEAEKYCLSHK